MSEAITSSHEIDLPRSPIVPFQPAEFPPRAETAPSVDSPDVVDDWQTVNFPNALSIDAIPMQVNEFQGNAAQNPQTDGDILQMEAPAMLALITELRQDNATLHQRITELESTIAAQQQALDQKVAHLQQQEALVAEQAQTIAAQSTDALQAQVSELCQELETSRQAVQQQQNCVDTLTAQLNALTAQLESSQERVAQLERECALTQQRHDEQVQLLVQAESTCRDLRSRLHRQQRQTLQYKAALEQCLEMPLAAEWVNNLVASAETASQPLNEPMTQRLPGKAQPVQPWRAQPGMAVPSLDKLRARKATVISEETDETALLSENLPSSEDERLGEFDRPSQESSSSYPAGSPRLTIVPSISSPEIASSDLAEADLLESDPADAFLTDADLAPGEAVSSISESQDAWAETTISESANPAELDRLPIFTPALERQIDKVVQSLMSEAGSQEDTLWEDLARLIGFPMDSDEAVTSPATLSQLEGADKLRQAELVFAERAPAEQSETVQAKAALATPESTSRLVVASETTVWDEDPETVTFGSSSADALSWDELDEEQIAEADDSAMTDEEGDPVPFDAEPLQYRSTEVLNLFRQVLHAEGQPIALPQSRSTASPFITLSTRKQPQPSMESDRAMATASTATLTTPGPSPLVYPFRPMKKLTSLAAVELPTFPRSDRL